MSSQARPEPNAAGLLPGDEVIDSDLDDSDDELREDGEDGGEDGEVDIVFCVYDKVGTTNLSTNQRASLTRGTGAEGQEQVEDGVQGWHDPHQRAGLPVRKV
jgi:transcription initiation factor TFIIA large subunit